MTKIFPKWNMSQRLYLFTVFILLAVSDAWTEEPSSSLRPSKRDSQMKYSSRSLRLNNNNITDLHDLHKPVHHFLAEPSQLAWLDLSFNKISHIDRVTVLSLHGLSACTVPHLSVFFVAVYLQSVCLCFPGFVWAVRTACVVSSWQQHFYSVRGG